MRFNLLRREANRTRALAAAAALAAVPAGCVGESPRRGGTPFEDLTLQNIVRWPTGKEYVQATGRGRPPEGEKDVETRRKAAREAAAVEAQRGLIDQLVKVMPRGKVHDVLRQAEAGAIEYGYDDACTLTLRIPREAVVGEKPIE